MYAADATERHFPEPVGYMALSVPARQHLGHQFCLDRLQRLLSGLLTGLRPWAASRASSSARRSWASLVWRSRMVICASSSDRSARSLAIAWDRMACWAVSSWFVAGSPFV
jgi:hypothetical protein